MVGVTLPLPGLCSGQQSAAVCCLSAAGARIVMTTETGIQIFDPTGAGAAAAAESRHSLPVDYIHVPLQNIHVSLSIGSSNSGI